MRRFLKAHARWTHSFLSLRSADAPTRSIELCYQSLATWVEVLESDFEKRTSCLECAGQTKDHEVRIANKNFCVELKNNFRLLIYH